MGLPAGEAEREENVSSAMVGPGVGAPRSGPACSAKLLCHQDCGGCRLYVCARGQCGNELLLPLFLCLREGRSTRHLILLRSRGLAGGVWRLNPGGSPIQFPGWSLLLLGFFKFAL